MKKIYYKILLQVDHRAFHLLQGDQYKERRP
jgi:hypothetical protein